MPAVMEDTHTEVRSFKYENLADVNPDFAPIPDDMYNLRLLKAEFVEYDKTATGGTKGDFVKLSFSITDHGTLAGRKFWPPALFPNGFTLRALRRLQDATGIPQDGNMQTWCDTLSQVQPVIRAKVQTVPDVNYKGVPNPRNINPDGSPGSRTEIDWKAGVSPAA